MRFALVNGNKTEAQPGLRGTCSHCQSDMMAYCGAERVWHWKHKRKSACDSWWENETEWHRAWKNHFPMEWQENIHIDSSTGEKHIADIKTDKDFVIEFQHSAIKPDEIKSRENFYKNMVWVVDGTRLKRDFSRFSKRVNEFRNSIVPGFFRLLFPEEIFPINWLTSSVPVYFDFKGAPSVELQDKLRDSLCCLLPGRVDRCAIIGNVSREQFVELSLTNAHLLLAKEHLSLITQHSQQQRALKEKRINQQAIPLRKYARNTRRGRYRRF